MDSWTRNVLLLRSKCDLQISFCSLSDWRGYKILLLYVKNYFLKCFSLNLILQEIYNISDCISSRLISLAVILSIFVLFCFMVTPGNTQGYFLFLYSGFTHGSGWGDHIICWDWNMVSWYKESTQLTLQPHLFYFLSVFISFSCDFFFCDVMFKSHRLGCSMLETSTVLALRFTLNNGELD